LYDQDTLDAIYKLTLDWTYEECLRLQHEGVREGMQASFRGHPLHVTAKVILDFAQQGLKNRGLMNSAGLDESMYLLYLYDLVDKQQCPADTLIKAFVEKYDRNVDAYLKGYLHQGPSDPRENSAWNASMLG
jgi:glutamate--cysteine ligase